MVDAEDVSEMGLGMQDLQLTGFASMFKVCSISVTRDRAAGSALLETLHRFSFEPVGAELVQSA